MSLLSRRCKFTNKAARRRRPLSRPDFELLEDRRLLAPLNPLDFLSLGAFPTAPGMYTIDTRGTTPTLSGPGGTFSGVVSGGVAVFDFDSITIGNGQTLVNTAFTVPAASPLPVALLSRSDATINGSVDVSALLYFGGPGGGNGSPGSGGPGAGGPGGSFYDPGPPNIEYVGGGGGGGFGGSGGAGGSISLNGVPGNPGASGGAGGGTYGDLVQQLQGGSAGGSTSGGFGGGGGGGGAIEIGAVDTLTIGGIISADGGSFGSPHTDGTGSGGGSGGILLHANSVTLSGTLSATGGSGDFGDGGYKFFSNLVVVAAVAASAS